MACPCKLVAGTIGNILSVVKDWRVSTTVIRVFLKM